MDNYGTLASPTQNKLKTPSGLGKLNAPVIPDASAAARVPGTPMVAPKANALAAKASPTMGSPYMQPKAQPRNALVADTIDGFMRGFNPQQYEKDVDRRKTEGADTMKQTLALMQQQRALPTEQRGQWWMQNAPVISEIIGQDVGSMQVDEAQFSDQALDGHIAALSAQMGIAPEKPEPMSAYEAEQIRLKELELNNPKSTGDKLTTEVGRNGNFWSFNTASGKMEDTGVQAPPERVNGETGSGLENGGVHSKERMQDGRILVTYRNGKQEIAIDPSTGQPALASDSYFAFDAGGVPVIGSRRTGTASPYATAEEVGTNQGAIEGFKVLGKAQGDAIKVLPEAISTSERVIQSIDELLNAPGFKGAYGVNRYLPQNMVPGSDAANAAAIRNKLDGQFFVNAVTAMQVSLAPVSDADALRLVASISQLSNPDISDAEALRVGNELKNYFRKAKTKAEAAAKRGPMKTPLSDAPATPPSQSFINRQMQSVQSAVAPAASDTPDGIDPEDWKYFTPEMKQQFLAGRGQ